MIARYIPAIETLYAIAMVLSYILLFAIYSAILRCIPIFQDDKGKLNIVGSVTAFMLSLMSFIALIKIVT